MKSNYPWIIAVGLACLVAGCQASSPETVTSETMPAVEPAMNPVVEPAAPATVEAGKINQEFAGLHNLMKVSDRIYSGSEPHGEPAFVSLKSLGVKTIVSVDGALPQVIQAHEHGIRYVHIPIGYDGVPKLACDSLTRVVRDTTGTIYIHCHHGKHRGPAAAAIAVIASGGVTGEQAVHILEQAGTSRDYTGLWRDVEHFVPAAPDASLPDLVETADVSSLVKFMADIDRRFDRVKLCRKQDWKAPSEHPEWQVLEELVLIKEGLAEANRQISQGFDRPFAQLLESSETATRELITALRSQETTKAEEAFLRLEKTCQQCHRQYRDH